VQRLSEHHADAAYLDQGARVHDAEPIDDLRHQPHVVADQYDRGSDLLLNAPQGLDDLALHHDVERAGRLIGDDHPRAQADRDRDHHPLFHPSAEFVRISVGDLRLQSDGRQQFADPRVERRARQRLAVVAQRVGELASDARDRIEGIHGALCNQRDRRQTQGAHFFLGKSEKVLAFEQRLAAFDLPRRLDQPHQCHCDSRLSRSGLADQPQPLACTQIETDAVDRPHRPQRRVVVNLEVAHLEDRIIAQVRQLPSCGAIANRRTFAGAHQRQRTAT
jgi:hypothetical protein